MEGALIASLVAGPGLRRYINRKKVHQPKKLGTRLRAEWPGRCSRGSSGEALVCIF
jgi:hypothetical protein